MKSMKIIEQYLKLRFLFAILILAFLPVIIILLFQAGHNQVIFMQNGQPLVYGTIHLVGSSDHEGRYTLDENGCLNLGWALFPKKHEYLFTLDNAHGNRIINSVIRFPIRGVQVNDYHDDRQIFTTTHFDLGPFESQTVFEQINMPKLE